jgi:hypothetical protein
MHSTHAKRTPWAAGLLTLAAALLVLTAAAGPAAAAKRAVANGTTTLTVPAARVTSLTAAGVSVVNVAPVAFRFLWDGSVSWSYAARVTAGSFDVAARKGTLYHAGGLRFVNVATGASLLLGGLRVYVNGPSSVVLQAAVGGPPVTRADVMVAATPAAFSIRRKLVSISAVQFRLTSQAVVALQTALVGTFDTSDLFAVADLEFRLK